VYSGPMSGEGARANVTGRAARLASMAAGVSALALASGIACAAPVGSFSQGDDFAPQPNAMAPTRHAHLNFDYGKSRWGLSLDMSQQPDRSTQWTQTRVGVTYRVAPGLRTGVGVMVGPTQLPDGRTLNDQRPAPRVRLETSLKF